jgi:hypothetical protein
VYAGVAALDAGAGVALTEIDYQSSRAIDPMEKQVQAGVAACV